MTAVDLLSEPPNVIAANATLGQAAAMLRQPGVTQLLVCVSGERDFEGVVTAKDLVA